MQIAATSEDLKDARSKSIASLGFSVVNNVESLLSIAHLFGTSKKRCGVYCLGFRGDIFYIGQAVDVVRRFAQHRRNYDDIILFYFMPAPKNQLDEIEKGLIYKAEAIGVKLKNAVHVSSILGETDFDLVMPIDEQEAWLSANSRLPAIPDEYAPRIILPERQLVRFSKNLDQFTKHPLRTSALTLLKKYICECIPVPRRAEYSFWSVSCMPSTNKNTWPRLFCVNAASMELFVVGWKKSSNLLWSVLTVDEDVLMQYWPNPDAFLERFSSVELYSRGYRDAGQNQITLCSSGNDVGLLLADPGVCKAAAALALRVMRKRANFYMQYHCSPLVDQALLRSKGSAPQ